MAILLYDGYCGLCSRSVQFILRHERERILFFAPLQGHTGQHALQAASMPTDYLDTLVLITDSNQTLVGDQAALALAKYLMAPWCWLGLFGILPRFITKWAYNLIARYRYRLFEKSKICLIIPNRAPGLNG